MKFLWSSTAGPSIVLWLKIPGIYVFWNKRLANVKKFLNGLSKLASISWSHWCSSDSQKVANPKVFAVIYMVGTLCFVWNKFLQGLSFASGHSITKVAKICALQKKFFAISKPHLIIMPGRRSKLFLMISTSSALVFFPVPYVSTWIDRGSAIPIPYETLQKTRSNKQEVWTCHISYVGFSISMTLLGVTKPT